MTHLQKHRFPKTSFERSMGVRSVDIKLVARVVHVLRQAVVVRVPGYGRLRPTSDAWPIRTRINMVIIRRSSKPVMRPTGSPGNPCGFC